VLADPEALRVAIDWRRSGRITRLVAGPNIVMSPRDEGGLIVAPEVDLCVVPSAWVADYYLEQAPSLAGRIGIWPAGVDISAFRPPKGRPAKDAIIYRKPLPGQQNASNADVDAVQAALQTAGWQVSHADYGSHSRRWYRGALARAGLLVFFSPTESQGIALQEAWAMDVPTLVWDGGTLDQDGERRRTSSAPYLSERTGAFFKTPQDFSRKLVELERGQLAIAPRAWVEEHGSDVASAAVFLKLVRGPARGVTAGAHGAPAHQP